MELEHLKYASLNRSSKDFKRTFYVENRNYILKKIIKCILLRLNIKLREKYL